MKTKWILTAGLAAAGFLTGCESIPPGAERGPHGTIAYDVLLEASEPGARIEANGESAGNTPVHLKIFGDTDGTFHDFGSDYYVVRAFPLATNQFVQTRVFRTGRGFNGEDPIPKRIYFDMNLVAPAYPPPGGPVYVYPEYYGPPPYYWGRPYYYGPSVRFHFGPPIHHRRW
jgi:hypothetical protein